MSSLLKPANVAQMLGLTLVTVYSHLKTGKLPGRKIGGRWFIPESELWETLASQPRGDNGCPQVEGL